jgi:hypothetical protein
MKTGVQAAHSTICLVSRNRGGADCRTHVRRRKARGTGEVWISSGNRNLQLLHVVLRDEALSSRALRCAPQRRCERL